MTFDNGNKSRGIEHPILDVQRPSAHEKTAFYVTTGLALLLACMLGGQQPDPAPAPAAATVPDVKTVAHEALALEGWACPVPPREEIEARNWRQRLKDSQWDADL